MLCRVKVRSALYVTVPVTLRSEMLNVADGQFGTNSVTLRLTQDEVTVDVPTITRHRQR